MHLCKSLIKDKREFKDKTLFQSEKIIDVDRRHITILDMQRLKAIVGECETG